MIGILLSLLLSYPYLALFPITWFEGPVLSIIVGALSAHGFFNPWYAFPILLAGVLAPDVAYYILGRYARDWRIVKKQIERPFMKDHLGAVRSLWYNHTAKTIFISKIAYGLSTPFLIYAGLVEVPIKKYIILALPITTLQFGALFMVGYYSGVSISTISNVFDHITILVTVLLALILGYYLIARYMRKRLLHDETTEESKATSV